MSTKENPPYHVTRHALIRFLEHNPQAQRDDIIDEAKVGPVIENQMADYLTGRKWQRREQLPQRYVLSKDRAGIFVILREEYRGNIQDKVITYLRLGGAQQNFTKKHWPQEVAA